MNTRVRTVLLNADLEPRAVIPVHRAFSLLFEDGSQGDEIGKVRVLLRATEVGSHHVPEAMRIWRSPGRTHPVPLVIALRDPRSPLFDLVHAPVGQPNLSALLIRDGGRCLYCLRDRSQLGRDNVFTIDHIKPRCRFPDRRLAHRWDNVALACFTCNNKKSDRTPKEAGMTLYGVPFEPTRLHLALGQLLPCQRDFLWLLRHGMERDRLGTNPRHAAPGRSQQLHAA